MNPWNPYLIQSKQAKISSQNGEDGVLLYILSMLQEIVPRRSFEVGAGLVDGNLECNTAILLNNGWKGEIFDTTEIKHPYCKQGFVSPENINSLIGTDPVGVLSIDVDGNDYWIWQAVKQLPPIVIIEYNAHIDPKKSLVAPYRESNAWDGSDYFGASAGAMIGLGKAKGYNLVAATNCLNLFFVHQSTFPTPSLYPIEWLGPIKRHPTYQGDGIYFGV